MDRGPAGASHRARSPPPTGVTRLEAAVDDDGRVLRSGLGPDRGRRRPHPRARAGDALPDARQSHRRLRHPQRRGAQPRGAHQQDADRAQPRLRRAAGLLRARTIDAAHRGRARPRSARGDPAQPRARPAPSPIAPPPAACSIPATTPARSISPSKDGGLAALQARRDAGARAGPALRHRPLRRRSSRASPTWATSRRC